MISDISKINPVNSRVTSHGIGDSQDIIKISKNLYTFKNNTLMEELAKIVTQIILLLPNTLKELKIIWPTKEMILNGISISRKNSKM